MTSLRAIGGKALSTPMLLFLEESGTLFLRIPSMPRTAHSTAQPQHLFPNIIFGPPFYKSFSFWFWELYFQCPYLCRPSPTHPPPFFLAPRAETNLHHQFW